MDKLLRIINETTNNRDIKVGKIDIFESCSKFDVDPKFADVVMNKFQGFVYQNRDIGVIVGSKRSDEGSSREKFSGKRENWKDRKKSSDRSRDSKKGSSKSYGEKRKFRR